MTGRDMMGGLPGRDLHMEKPLNGPGRIAVWMTIAALIFTMFGSLGALAYGHGRAVERLDKLTKEMEAVHRIETIVIRLAEREGISIDF